MTGAVVGPDLSLVELLGVLDANFLVQKQLSCSKRAFLFKNSFQV